MLLEIAVSLLLFCVLLLGAILYALSVMSQNQVQISANRRQESDALLLALSSTHKVLLDMAYKRGKT